MPSKVSSSVKEPKDSNAPKKPHTAYMLFSADERPKLKASGLDNFAEMNKALGAAWKQADLKIKAHYEKEHERDKLRYENEMKEYNKPGAPAPKPEPKAKAPIKAKTSTATTKSSSNGSSSKKKPTVNEDDSKDDEEDSNSDDDEEEDESEEEEEEKPAPKAKGLRKK